QCSPAVAARDLNRYRRKGPDATSRLLLGGLRGHVTSGASLLDIGGGVGVLDFELLANGVESATLVDASPAYLDAAGREAQARQMGDRFQRVVGDFAVVGDGIASADVVTMHRVVCCYPDHASLLQAATKHARRVFVSICGDKHRGKLFSAPRPAIERRSGQRARSLRTSGSARSGRTPASSCAVSSFWRCPTPD